ncbi:hypothetical protein D7V97_25140 [Corallococcus sp. CA053C]|uniref:hypothetical protein n=1 Tax=Corallococcus sp. CA053C TaxID=2316732 RepID=UPI000EA06F9B|nr:hypothetical protein [Corallococcus sp. CA053C]RKH04607.1 hypothetical protein D7V97_25140 [Corallococcus sp. CA053C]
MKAFRPLLAAALFLSFPALAADVHSIWSSKGLFVKDDTAGSLPVTSSNAVVSWNVATRATFLNFHGFAGGNEYDFELVGSPASTTIYEITGLWNVRRNGVLVCGGCTGRAYELTALPGNYFKLYTTGEVYGFGAYVTTRKDY